MNKAPNHLAPSGLDRSACYEAIKRRDRRFDGMFFTGVTSTGIYCRPSCPARTPAQANVTFFVHAAAAGDAGFRPCRRCRPELAPGHPEWNRRADLTGRALQLIGDGEGDRLGVTGLARRLGVSERHLRRELRAEVGVGPSQLIQNRRLSTARLLLDQTQLSATDVAFAAGFSSVRRFNEAFQDSFALTPSDVRRSGAANQDPGSDHEGQTITLSLPSRSSRGWFGWYRYLATRAIPGLETAEASTTGAVFRRGITGGWFEIEVPLEHEVPLEPGKNSNNQLTLRCHLDSLDQLTSVVASVRRLADLDTDHLAIADSLCAADALLAQRIDQLGGYAPRLATGIDGFEVAVRAIIGQQVSVAGATTTLGRLLSLIDPIPTDSDEPSTLRRGFPTANEVACAPLERLGVPDRRRQTLRTLAEQVAKGRVDLSPGADRDQTKATLLKVPGIGPWTAGYIAMRGLSDPDGWPSGDLVLRKSLSRPGAACNGNYLEGRAQRWRPWRAYGAMVLWATATPAKEKKR